jgi:hypothetical protein
MAIKKNCTAHITEARLERVMWIIENIGYGNVIAERDWVDTNGTNCIRQLTDTGVIIVLSADRSKVVTMFVATVLQIKAMYHGRIANWLYKVAIKNEKLLKGK